MKGEQNRRWRQRSTNQLLICNMRMRTCIHTSLGCTVVSVARQYIHGFFFAINSGLESMQKLVVSKVACAMKEKSVIVISIAVTMLLLTEVEGSKQRKRDPYRAMEMTEYSYSSVEKPSEAEKPEAVGSEWTAHATTVNVQAKQSETPATRPLLELWTPLTSHTVTT